ncbi:hypothetical protein MFIFM68171_07185 [Madurella fahalii]|uniref:Uncharacterized protein n=1 Tax=Madurella fahalii TaxID=1157608 RepID=A0ABQ0GH14_9PEZI
MNLDFKLTRHRSDAEGPVVEFETCVGIVVTGTPAGPDKLTRFLAHLGLGANWAEFSASYTEFMEAVVASRMNDMEATLLTVETDLTNHEYGDDEYLQETAADLAITYSKIPPRLQSLVGQGRPVRHLTHPFGTDASMQADQNNQVQVRNT